MRHENREEILKEVEERIKTMVKELLEALMREEREIYLENHPTKANGYYTRDLLTLVGPVEDLKVPRVQEGHFHPPGPPVSQAGFAGTFRSHPCPLGCRCEYPDDFRVLERDLRDTFTAKHFLPHRSRFGTSRVLAGKPSEWGAP